MNDDLTADALERIRRVSPIAAAYIEHDSLRYTDPAEYHDRALAKVLRSLERPAWQAAAACRGSTVDFYPGRGQSTEPAKAVCAGCSVSDECLQFALETGEKVGIWGGLSERERRQLRRARRGAA